jgi:hypothetical protein
MRYTLLASDYDETLARNGLMSERAEAALQRWKADGRRLLLITGRSLDNLRRHVPQLSLFDGVVSENGAVIYQAANQQQHLLGERPPHALVEAIREQGVDYLFIGKVIIGTLGSYEAQVQRAIDTLGIPWHIIRNKGNIMILPAQVNKAAGLHAALGLLGQPLDATVGVGDAENDYDFLDICGYSAAVANALPELKQRVHLVTQGEHGDGIAELVDTLLQQNGH